MSKSLLDRYYKRPSVYDLIITIVIIILLVILEQKNIIKLDFDCESKTIAGIGITISGFVLTILTILITLKSNELSIKEKKKKNNNSFKIFLKSELYGQSINILKNGVLSLLIVSFLTLALSMFFDNLYCAYGIYLDLACIIFIIMVFLRSFYILNLIFKMQNKE